METQKIDSFSGENRFLSNFWPAKITYNGKTYTSVEHAYQAQKTTNEDIREEIRLLEKPGQAKIYGESLKSTLSIRPDWTDKMRILIMTELVELKFSENNPDLVSKLLRTENAELIEGNDWGDIFFGVCNGEGKNHLGNILMARRNKLKFEILSPEEILEGNKLFLDFMGFDSNKSDKWITECSLFDKSWDELMKVAEKISKTYGEYSDGINERTFNFKHMMFYEIIGNRNYLYRRCVNWVKHYKSVRS